MGTAKFFQQEVTSEKDKLQEAELILITKHYA